MYIFILFKFIQCLINNTDPPNETIRDYTFTTDLKYSLSVY